MKQCWNCLFSPNIHLFYCCLLILFYVWMLCIVSMGMLWFTGGWWVLGGRAEWTDRCLPIVGGRARPCWRGGGGGGETVFSVCKSWLFYLWMLQISRNTKSFVYLFSDWVCCSSHIHLFSSLSPPPPCLPSLPPPRSPQTLAAVQSSALPPLAVWRTNSGSFLRILQTTQRVSGVKLSSSLSRVSVSVSASIPQSVFPPWNVSVKVVMVVCVSVVPSETGGSSHNSPALSRSRPRPVRSVICIYEYIVVHNGMPLATERINKDWWMLIIILEIW